VNALPRQQYNADGTLEFSNVSDKNQNIPTYEGFQIQNRAIYKPNYEKLTALPQPGEINNQKD
jgi:hypothetical protein